MGSESLFSWMTRSEKHERMLFLSELDLCNELPQISPSARFCMWMRVTPTEEVRARKACSVSFCIPYITRLHL